MDVKRIVFFIGAVIYFIAYSSFTWSAELTLAKTLSLFGVTGLIILGLSVMAVGVVFERFAGLRSNFIFRSISPTQGAN